MKKNVAGQSVSFQMLNSDGDPVTTGTPVVYVTGDNGTQGTGSGTSTHKGNGQWSYVPGQAETNYDHIAFTMVLANAFNQTINIYTNTPQTGDSFAIVNSGTYGNSALRTLTLAIKSVTDNLPNSGALTELVAYVDTLETTLNHASHGLAALKTLSDTIDDFVDTEISDIITHLTDIKGTGFVKDTHSLPQCLTGAGGSSPTVEQIRAEIDSNSTQLTALITRLTSARAGYLDKLNVTGTLAHSNAAGTYKADVSNLATTTGLAAVADLISNLQDISYGQVNAACDAALVDYGANTTTPPTVEAIEDAVLDGILPDLADNALNVGEDITARIALRAVLNRFFREVTLNKATGLETVKGDAGQTISVMACTETEDILTKGAST